MLTQSHMPPIAQRSKPPGPISLNLAYLWVQVQKTSSGGALVPFTTCVMI
jgi:hypothetical protein